MNTRNKRIVAGAAALALFAIAVAVTVKGLSPAPGAPPAAEFAMRFQPTLAAVAGIGSTRELRPVPLDSLPASAPASRNTVAGAGVDHGSGRAAR